MEPDLCALCDHLMEIFVHMHRGYKSGSTEKCHLYEHIRYRNMDISPLNLLDLNDRW